MALSEDRWRRVSSSDYPWEREALEYIRTGLPDAETYAGWTNGPLGQGSDRQAHL